VFLLVLLLSDSSVMYEFPDGRTVAMISDGNVSMTAESVFIFPAEGMYGAFGDFNRMPNMSIRCVFSLLNRSSEEQILSVGFPLDARYGDAYTAMDDSMLFEVLSESFADEYRPPWNEERVVNGRDAMSEIAEEMDFRALINGTETPVFYRKCALSAEDDLIWQPVVAVWKMTFQPGEKIILENTYNTSWDFFGGGPRSSSTIKYILTSGAGWDGPIGEAFIRLVIPAELPEPLLDDTLAVYWDWSGSPVVDGRTVTWEYRDFEPHENLYFSVVAESRLNHWDYFIDPLDMYNSLDWDGENLLADATDYVRDALVWNPVFDSILLARILEGLPYMAAGHRPPNGLYTGVFNASELDGGTELAGEQLYRLRAAEIAAEGVQRNIDSAEQAGYGDFLPVFSTRRSWDTGALDMYSASPGKESKYLDLLEHLERAAAGEWIADPDIRAFYELTGWYREGYSSLVSPVPSLSVIRYREVVQNGI